MSALIVFFVVVGGIALLALVFRCLAQLLIIYADWSYEREQQRRPLAPVIPLRNRSRWS